MKSKSKTKKVLDHLIEKGSITSWEAINLYGATRLSAIIFNLRKKGHLISTVDILETDRYGDDVKFAKYYFAKQPNLFNQDGA